MSNTELGFSYPASPMWQRDSDMENWRNAEQEMAQRKKDIKCEKHKDPSSIVEDQPLPGSHRINKNLSPYHVPGT